MIKTRLTGGSVLVTFELPAAVATASVHLCGEFNDWSPASHPLTRTDTGRFHTAVDLQAGRRWRFRYLLEGGRWENDWAADDYLPNDHGGDDSVVDLTDTSAVPLAPDRPADAGTVGDVDAAVPDEAISAGPTGGGAGGGRAGRARKTATAARASSETAAPAKPRKATAARAETGKRPAGPVATADTAVSVEKDVPAEEAREAMSAQRPRAKGRRATPRRKPVTPAE